MTPSRVNTTRCPKCKTNFRVTQAQLNAAEGSVRCGSCLHVFNALSGAIIEHTTSSPSLPEASIKKRQSEVPEVEVRPEEASASQIREPEVGATETKPEPLEVEPSPDLASSASSEPETTSEQVPGLEASISNIINNIQKEQVDVDQRSLAKQKILKRKRRNHAILILLACMGLVTQYLWFNKNHLSLNPELRPYYQAVCHRLGCQLPPIDNTSQIQSAQLLVRSHPEKPDMMIVDAVVVNQSDYPQPWPDLSLAFTDINDQPVASRLFTPNEYLGGELAGSLEMPASQAIRLSIELMDPGPEAVNYRLTFRGNNL